MSEINNTKELPEGIFPVNLKTINHFQQKDPRLNSKYKIGAYQKGYSRGGSNIYLNFITCKDKVVITSIIRSCVLHWYHTYLLHPVIDRTDAEIFQHLY